jgi:hypothetical protein
MAFGVQDKRGVPGPKIYENKEQPTTQFAGMKLKEKLQSIANHAGTVDREQRIRRNTGHYLMALYYQGYQNIELTPGSDTFDVYEREDFYVENQFRRHVDSVVNSLSKNEGELVIRPGGPSPQDLAKARAAGPILDMQKAGIGYDKIKHDKNLMKALFGTAFVFNDYIRDSKHGQIVTPKFEYQEMPDPEGGDPYMSKVPAGFSKVNRGREIAVVCSPLEINCKTDVKSFEDLPWLRWKSRQDVELVNYMYPGLGSPGGSSADEDMAQQYLDVLGNLPGNALGDSSYNRGTTHGRKVEYARTWLQPCMFAGDKELMRNFPDGVHVVTVDGVIVDYYGENLLDRWTYEVLIPVPHSLLGDGLYDILMQQDQINEVNSLIIQHVRYSTVGHKIYDSTMIDVKDIINDPANGWIKATPSLDKTIQQAVKEVQPGQLSTDVASWLQNAHLSMQDMSSAYDPSVGKGIGANTPYSQSVFLTERAQSRWQGSMAHNRPQLVRFHQQLLKIAQNDWLETRTQAVMANTGAWSFQQFSQADLVGEIDISFSNTDMQPKGRAEQIQALQMLNEMAMLLPMLPPKQKLRVEEILGMPPDSNPMNTQISRAYRQIDRIAKGEPIAPLPFVDDPNGQLPVIWDFLASEEGEDVALTNPEAFAAIYTYGNSLMMMLQGQQGFVMPGQQPPPQPGAAGGTPPAGGKKQPGGQPGQAPGGPEAQSPAPAPPVSPPSA